MRQLFQKTGRHFYAILFGEDALERACREISDSDCHEQRYNRGLNIANGAATKLAEQIAGPNLVLIWLLQVLGSPVWMLGCLVPIKQTFSLLPQMIAAGQIRRLAIRKWVWVFAALIQTICLLFIAFMSTTPSPLIAGLAILILFSVFSMASGTASVAFQDVIGKTVTKGHRGKLLATRSLIGGVLTLAAGALLTQLRDSQDPLWTIQILLLCAAALWAIGGLFFAGIREDAGATSGARNPVNELKHGLIFFRQHLGFRQFITVRALLLSVELATPFYFIHARSIGSIDGSDIGLLVAAIGLSQLLSSPFWGRLVAALLALSLMLVPSVDIQKWLYVGVFILIGLAESGIRLSRKTYLVDAVPSEERATFAALSNCMIGTLALTMSVLGLVAQFYGISLLIALLGGLALIATIACQRLPEADHMLSQVISQ
ncbi:MAG: MFS transporter [Deltaproteobacteria bacterium]|nr:MFS transporter [Deltaproteobacteria bacterium]